MKRINGYLDLDHYFENKDLTSDDIREADDYQNWLMINGEEYFYKLTKYPYSELIASEIAHYLGMNSVSYDLAIFRGIKGVISKSYRKDNCRYISGMQILKNYMRSSNTINILKDMGLKNKNYFLKTYLPRDINNLETIWQAIECRCSDLNIPINIEKNNE